MKYEKYEKPDLEELEILLEGSYLNGSTSDKEGLTIDPDEGDIFE